MTTGSSEAQEFAKKDSRSASTDESAALEDFFEGPEKTLVLEFTRCKSSLRLVDDETWSAILMKAECTILSKVASPLQGKRGGGCTAYLLSESSMFVYDRRVVLKTCGRTAPLRALPDLLALGKSKAHGGHVASLVYTHPAFGRPEEQPEDHASFATEAAQLRELLPQGEAHHLGPEGQGVDLFVANLLPATAVSDWVQAEVYARGLNAPERFSGAPHPDVAAFWGAEGPAQLGEHHFEPYGYSANALKTAGFYATVHASPQEECSYMSYATNATLPAEQLVETLTRALALSGGERATVFLLALSPLLAIPMPQAIPGYDRTALVTSENAQFACAVATFTRTAPKPRPALCGVADPRAAASAFLAEQPPLFDTPVMMLHLGTVEAKYRQWAAALPRVQPCYAVKCNPDPGLIAALLRPQQNPGLDCASVGEITLALQLGVRPERIIYSNPAKQASGIAFARRVGVQLLVVDAVGEVEKVAELYPEAQLLLRVQTDDGGAQCPLSNKFGCPVQACPGVLQAAKDRGVQVAGVSFHVGSGCSARGCFTEAIARARAVMAVGEELGFAMDWLDIGGGFPGSNDYAKVPFEEMAQEIEAALAAVPASVTVVGEPGRFFAQSCGTLLAQVIAVSPVPGAADGALRYYLNDGLYGCFNCLLYDHATVAEVQLLAADEQDREVVAGTFFGPTCDGFDALFEKRMARLRAGDWLLFPEFGAYTSAAASGFNGLTPAVVHHY